MSEPLTPEREAEIRARAEAATPGPWEECRECGDHFYAYLGGSYLRGVGTLNFGDGKDADADRAFTLHARDDLPALLAEIDRLRAELAATVKAKQENDERFQLAAAEQRDRADRLRDELDLLRDELGSLDRNTLPQLRREIQHHQDGKKRWRDRAEKAEARVAELERPSIEARRNEIRSSYTALISQAEQDRDAEGAATLTLQLRESEAKWATEDAQTGGDR